MFSFSFYRGLLEYVFVMGFIMLTDVIFIIEFLGYLYFWCSRNVGGFVGLFVRGFSLMGVFTVNGISFFLFLFGGMIIPDTSA